MTALLSVSMYVTTFWCVLEDWKTVNCSGDRIHLRGAWNDMGRLAWRLFKYKLGALSALHDRTAKMIEPGIILFA